MIRHVVMWSIKDEITGEEKMQAVLKMKEMIEALKPVIKEIIECEVGINANPNEKFDISINTVFENFETLKIYNDHPAHQEVVKYVRSIVNQRCAIDYEI